MEMMMLLGTFSGNELFLETGGETEIGMIDNKNGNGDDSDIVCRMREIPESVKEVLESERLLTARLVDSVLRTSQMAGLATPEMREMFDQWLSIVARQVLRELEETMGEKRECDLPALAKNIGVEETTLFSLLIFLHRSGKLRIEGLRFSPGQGKNTEACDCLIKEDS
jgi:hypothetical protein